MHRRRLRLPRGNRRRDRSPVKFSLENKRAEEHRLVQAARCVIPAWSAGIQVNMDVSESIPANLMPAIHAGMTKICVFMFCRRAQAHGSVRGILAPFAEDKIS